MASIAICNIALAEVRASPISSLGDNSPEARACSTHYDDCVATLMEEHDWAFARKRVTLAALATNDRSSEWFSAYAAPADMAQTGAIIYPLQTPISGVYYPWPYNYPRPPYFVSDFVYDSGVIYSNISGAILEYITKAPDESVMPAMFKRAVALDLASRLAMTLLNDRTLKGDLIQQAETAKRRAMADDLNRQPRRDVPFMDDVARVRS